MTTYQRSTTINRRQSQWRRNQNTVAFTSNVTFGPVTHTVLVALMITVLGLIYLTQATKVTTYGYETQPIDDKIAELTNQKAELEVQNTLLTSLDSIKNSNVAKAMTEPTDVARVEE
ncbi:MAG: hypothetical protein ACSLEY_03700 [Candidatus Saccharimonadales bacterium]